MTRRSAADLMDTINSSHIHEVAFSPIHQHSLLPELKGVSHSVASPLTGQCMNMTQKRWFLNKELKTLTKTKHQMEKTTHENDEVILFYLIQQHQHFTRGFTVFKGTNVKKFQWERRPRILNENNEVALQTT